MNGRRMRVGIAPVVGNSLAIRNRGRMNTRMIIRMVAVIALLGALLTACSAAPQPAAPPNVAATTAPAAPEKTTPPKAPKTSKAPKAPKAPASSKAPKPAPAADDNQFGVGAKYSGKCTVAWPTAPTITSTTIQMTMSCTGVPSKYLLVLVVYDDPTLKVTPSTGAMTVTGFVRDFAQTQMGTVPIIQATTITIP